MILVTGFGPFPGVTDNPTAPLARALDGQRVAGHRVLGRVLPVSYARASQTVLALISAHQPALVIGMGVATSAQRPRVELRAVPAVTSRIADVDGAQPAELGEGEIWVAEALRAGLTRFADDLAGELSQDAGQYVCNAWLYRVLQGWSGPAFFLHLPPGGAAPERLMGAMETLLGTLSD